MLVFIQVAYMKLILFLFTENVFIFALVQQFNFFFICVWVDVPEYWVIQLNLIPGNWFTRENRREMWYK